MNDFLLLRALKIAIEHYKLIFSSYNQTQTILTKESPVIRVSNSNYYTIIQDKSKVFELIKSDQLGFTACKALPENITKAVDTYLNYSLSFNSKKHSIGDNNVITLYCMRLSNLCHLSVYRYRQSSKKIPGFAMSLVTYKFSTTRDFRYYGTYRFRSSSDTTDEMQFLYKPDAIKKTTVLDALVFGMSIAFASEKDGVPMAYGSMYNKVGNSMNMKKVSDDFIITKN